MEPETSRTVTPPHGGSGSGVSLAMMENDFAMGSPADRAGPPAPLHLPPMFTLLPHAMAAMAAMLRVPGMPGRPDLHDQQPLALLGRSSVLSTIIYRLLHPHGRVTVRRCAASHADPSLIRH